MSDAIAQQLKRLERILGDLSNQVELERTKTFSLMEAVINRFDLSVVDAKSEFAGIAPIERMSGKTDFTALAFSSLAQALSMPVSEFFGMSSRSGQTTYFIKDHTQAWYQRGLLGLSQNIPSTVDVLTRLTAQSAHDIRCFGASAGGFAAILFGNLLKARKVVAFSPQTILNQQTIDRFRSQDTRIADVLKGQYLDLVPLLEHNETCEIHIHYGAGQTDDVAAAERLRGLPNVTLHAHDFAGHNIGLWLRNTRQLDAALAPIFKDPAQSPDALAPPLSHA